MSDKKIKSIEKLIQEVSQSDINVLIEGEVGTGKEFSALNIHRLSSRKDNPFITVNVTTITSIEKKQSYFEKAEGGTLYLDEIGNLGINEQEKMLEILITGKIDSFSGACKKNSDVRIIAATRKDLQKEVAKGNFIPELYEILKGVKINLPPLREFGEEIIELSDIFILEYSKKNRKPIKHLSQGAKEILLNYDYPQNIRELKAIIELTLMMSYSQIIYPEDIYLRQNIRQVEFLAIERTLQDYESIIVEHFLKKYDNKVYYVAEKLGVSKNKIYSMINKGIVDNG